MKLMAFIKFLIKKYLLCMINMLCMIIYAMYDKWKYQLEIWNNLVCVYLTKWALRVLTVSDAPWHSPGDVVNVDLRFSPSWTCGVQCEIFALNAMNTYNTSRGRMHTRRKSRVSKDISQRDRGIATETGTSRVGCECFRHSRAPAVAVPAEASERGQESARAGISKQNLVAFVLN